ncbi:MAG: DUF1571 domain-containing protein [Planctomycetota bacterium]|nr:MAG: DUF1571 domain-containing protein [Planctomycetota bacterium]
MMQISLQRGYCSSHLQDCLLLVLSTLIFASVVGCGGGFATKDPERMSEYPKRYVKEGQRIQADPVSYIKNMYARCEALEQYRLMFYRQERLGLFGRMGPMEEIRACFRRDPFSVKFEWDDPERDYYESVYVAGENNDKLIVRERKGLLGFAPQVRVVNLSDPVIWGKSKNPVTDFGLAQVTRRTLLPFEDPEVAAVMTIKYAGLVELGPKSGPAHYLLIERPKTEGLRYTRQDFYIDAETGLPAGTDLWLPSGKLDARYRYSEVDTKATFTDADFRLSKDHPQVVSK